MFPCFKGLRKGLGAKGFNGDDGGFGMRVAVGRGEDALTYSVEETAAADAADYGCWRGDGGGELGGEFGD